MRRRSRSRDRRGTRERSGSSGRRRRGGEQQRSAYAILGIHPSATDDEVREAFKIRARELHPDRGGSKDDFAEVRTAYDWVLNQRGITDMSAAGREKVQADQRTINSAERLRKAESALQTAGVLDPASPIGRPAAEFITGLPEEELDKVMNKALQYMGTEVFSAIKRQNGKRLDSIYPYLKGIHERLFQRQKIDGPAPGKDPFGLDTSVPARPQSSGPPAGQGGTCGVFSVGDRVRFRDRWMGNWKTGSVTLVLEGRPVAGNKGAKARFWDQIEHLTPQMERDTEAQKPTTLAFSMESFGFSSGSTADPGGMRSTSFADQVGLNAARSSGGAAAPAPPQQPPAARPPAPGAWHPVPGQRVQAHGLPREADEFNGEVGRVMEDHGDGSFDVIFDSTDLEEVKILLRNLRQPPERVD